jgi:hypothetical protein
MTIDKEKILISRVMTLDTSNMRDPTPFIEGPNTFYREL